MSAVVNAAEAAKILGCKNLFSFRSLKQRADFPSVINPEVVRGRLWNRADIVRFDRDYKKGAIDPLVSTVCHHFLTGKFATEPSKLQAMSKRTIARLNKHQSITVRINGA